MNNLFRISVVLFGMLAGSNAISADQGFEGGPVDAACGEQSTNECYCRYVRYEPRYTNCPRVVEDRVPCTKTCTRVVPQYYEVEKCRMVPQYYKEKYCVNRTECYQVPDTKICKRIVYDQKCDYVPRYYWKHNCGDSNAIAAPRGYVKPADDCCMSAPMSAPSMGGCCGPNGCSR